MHLSWSLKHSADKYNMSNACRSRKLCFSQPEPVAVMLLLLKASLEFSTRPEQRDGDTIIPAKVSWLRSFPSVMKPLVSRSVQLSDCLYVPLWAFHKPQGGTSHREHWDLSWSWSEVWQCQFQILGMHDTSAIYEQYITSAIYNHFSYWSIL